MLAKTLKKQLDKASIKYQAVKETINGTTYEAKHNSNVLQFVENDQGCCDIVRCFKSDDRFSFAENYDRGVYARTAKEAIAMLTA